MTTRKWPGASGRAKRGWSRLEVFAVDAPDVAPLAMTRSATAGWAWASMGSSSCGGGRKWKTVGGLGPDVRDGSRINHRQQISRASDWLDWSSLDQPAFGYSTRTWQTDEGLPDNVVEAITQTQDRVFMGRDPRGPARFDGMVVLTASRRALGRSATLPVTRAVPGPEEAVDRHRRGRGWARSAGRSSRVKVGLTALQVTASGPFSCEGKDGSSAGSAPPWADAVKAAAGITPEKRGCSRICCSKIG